VLVFPIWLYKGDEVLRHAWKSWKNQAEAVIHSMMEKIPKYKSSG